MTDWRSPIDKFVHPLFLPNLAREIRADGWKVVATGGCFDLLHLGHIRFLEAARKLGGPVIVCLNMDDSVHKLKGLERPIYPYQERLEMVAALSSVSHVTWFSNPTPEELVSQFKPDIWVKGGDYQDQDLPERAVIESYGGQVVILPELSTYRTTTLLERLRAPSEASE